jgi:hypothetical protein
MLRVVEWRVDEAANFDLAEARRNIERVGPGMRIFESSSGTGFGMEEILGFLRSQLSLPRGVKSMVRCVQDDNRRPTT